MIPRYTRPRMGSVWSDEHRAELWLKVELAVCEAWADMGVIPEEDIVAIRGATVQTELRLLEAGKQELFRQTFLRSVQPQVTTEAFEACRKRVQQVLVRPDWETAKPGKSRGHRVVRVSIFGKSMTGFHEVDGRWLADAVWCLPVGLP